MEIINAHVHLSKKAAGDVPKGDINDLVRDMESAGISRSIVISVFLSDGDPECEYSVKELVDIAREDRRISVVYSVDLDLDLEEQRQEVEDLMGQGLMKGIKILLGYFNVMPDDERLSPFYDLCEKHDLPAVFHTGDSLGSKAKLKYSHPLNIDSLAVDRPNLKIVMAHVGNPWLVDAAEVIYKNPNVYGDISGFFLGFDDKRYVEWMRGKVNDLIAYAGGDKLLFGTDFPLAGAADYVRFAEGLDLGDEEKGLMFSGNAKRLFRLDV